MYWVVVFGRNGIAGVLKESKSKQETCLNSFKLQSLLEYLRTVCFSLVQVLAETWTGIFLGGLGVSFWKLSSSTSPKYFEKYGLVIPSFQTWTTSLFFGGDRPCWS